MTDRLTSLIPRLRGSLSAKMLVAVLMGSIVLMIPLTAMSNPAHIMAPTGPLTVYGYVYDFYGQPVEGASVVVTDTRTHVSVGGTTDSDGLYQASPEFSTSEYDLGDTLEVVANYDSHIQSTSDVVTQEMIDMGLAQIDVHYTYEIPEFGSVIGYAVAGILVGMVAVVAIGTRKARK